METHGKRKRRKTLAICPYCEKPITNDPRSAYRDSRNKKLIERVSPTADGHLICVATHVKVHKICEGIAMGIKIVAAQGSNIRWMPKITKRMRLSGHQPENPGRQPLRFTVFGPRFRALPNYR